MHDIKFEILPISLLNDYLRQINPSVSRKFHELKDSELSANTFSFYTSVSTVFSSKIEGEDIDLDSFIKHKKWGANFLPDHTQKIDDLYDTYLFTQNNPLTEVNIQKAHALLTRHILTEGARDACVKAICT